MADDKKKSSNDGHQHASIWILVLVLFMIVMGFVVVVNIGNAYIN
ncbi:MAG: hypothetical protein ABIE68_04710 [bacterium]